jgi:DNA-binding transcriptional ArsR family regulator
VVRETSADWIGALGHPLRLWLIELLAAQPATIGILADRVGASRSVVSKHLRVLTWVGVVAREQEGNAARYSLADNEIVRLIAIAYRISVRDLRRLRDISDLLAAADPHGGSDDFNGISQLRRSTSAEM